MASTDAFAAQPSVVPHDASLRPTTVPTRRGVLAPDRLADLHPLARPPETSPLLTAAEVRATADSIAAMQDPDGAIPWFPGGHTDAWDHLECAMALELGGRDDAAQRAWDWLLRNQRDDGSWATSYIGGGVRENFADSNQCAYVATAVWHHWRRTGDAAFVAALWPVVRAALDFVIDMQAPSGVIWWARDAEGNDYPLAMLTGCSSTLHSLRCGLGLAALVGDARPDWELAAGRLAHALRAHPEYFAPTSRWSMDWYYPVIGGALRGAEGLERLRGRWADFVIEGLGIRCVSDEPWVTGAETCELAIALHLVGETPAARTLVRDMQHLRHHDGAYWTGWQFVGGAHWPDERSTWTAAAVILAVDTLSGGVTEAVFRGDDLPEPLPTLAPDDEEFDDVESRDRLGCDCDPAPVIGAWSTDELAGRLAS
ncbi:hypothetical protein I6A60_06635 [Frankia sp. AgB1.9]|uniref:prenyltransferase/squalene oxidase repeat-containing protein n=1 Tax=unclassified Frankia TaxID=2632575 RepID=UPI00193238BC|nr:MULTISPECIES: prenyltransferase/squalene oxidase repeat-containing protein [unclassified Frankia]MBL7490732.1 hypothetical protein [Frankia sp. AgW1.1]MBL7547551.1 hypothetical protein [Frankia sp. AgB1.9]MBL7622980.1 hypothetical protein [Frankia sp. AgB1.8]